MCGSLVLVEYLSRKVLAPANRVSIGKRVYRDPCKPTRNGQR
jgi:hypothetical protein